MVIRIIITFSLVVIIGGVGAYTILNSVVEPIIAPRAELSDVQFSRGACQEDWVLFWVVGHHQMVTATFTLKNDGLSDGDVRVLFTAEGAQVAWHDFFIGAGKAEVKTFQFRMNDCGEHGFSAHLGGVERS